MRQNLLIVTLDGPGVGEVGVLAADFERVLAGMHTAMRLMVGHLGGRKPGPGQPPAWVRDQSRLRLVHTGPGSFVAELTQEPPSDTQLRIENHGQEALAALGNWDGSEHSTLPPPVTNCLYKLASDLSGSTRFWIGSTTEPRRVEVRRSQERDAGPTAHTRAFLQGWLKEVNWDKGTAQLHDYAGDYVRLRFAPPLGGEMLRLATQYVEVRGKGVFHEGEMWKTVAVEQLNETRSWSEALDLKAFLRDPGAKVFDPDAIATIDLTEEEWESFNRATRESRDI